MKLFYTGKNTQIDCKSYLICLELEPEKSSGHAPRITLEGMKREMIESGFNINGIHFPTESLYLVIVQKAE
ncbi:hypothetical protein JMA_09370 [Jeotgalibacillus malaysiensis]|uniref:Uncharacterized protein n=1 Tax=Jeotgalibacillus malaysiensis TaxID=1508404 RepID=A0A0B5AQ95_9BACL|nr:hypothetical protein JMA_09370 [Jeotgalibacillus malaysiensis]